jgi:hypothetical protein
MTAKNATKKVITMTNETKEQGRMSAREIEAILKTRGSEDDIAARLKKSLEVSDSRARAVQSRRISLTERLSHPLMYARYRSLERAEDDYTRSMNGREGEMMGMLLEIENPDIGRIRQADEIVLSKWTLDSIRGLMNQYERALDPVMPAERKPYSSPNFDKMLEKYYPAGYNNGSVYFCRDRSEFERRVKEEGDYNGK